MTESILLTDAQVCVAGLTSKLPKIRVINFPAAISPPSVSVVLDGVRNKNRVTIRLNPRAAIALAEAIARAGEQAEFAEHQEVPV